MWIKKDTYISTTFKNIKVMINFQEFATAQAIKAVDINIIIKIASQEQFKRLFNEFETINRYGVGSAVLANSYQEKYPLAMIEGNFKFECINVHISSLGDILVEGVLIGRI